MLVGAAMKHDHPDPHPPRPVHGAIGEPLLCLLCTGCGVLLSTALPIAAGAQITTLSQHTTLLPCLLIALAVRVFDRRSWERWRSSRQRPLGARILGACSDGMQWP